jgi:hypothetical protein
LGAKAEPLKDSYSKMKSVIQTIYEIAKAHSGAFEIETLPAPKESFVAGEAEKKVKGSEFIITLPILK